MFDVHNVPSTEDGWDEDGAAEYCEGLIGEFAVSIEGMNYAKDQGHIAWIWRFLEYAGRYLGKMPPEMTWRDVEEIVFEWFPRKITTEPESAAAMIGELRAFWTFLDRQYQLPHAAAIAKKLDRNAQSQLQHNLSDPTNFGLAKSIVLMGTKAGFDMWTQEGAEAFTQAFNASLFTSPKAPAAGAARQRYSSTKQERKALARLAQKERDRTRGT